MLRRWLIALVAVLALSINACAGAPEPGQKAFAVFTPGEGAEDATASAVEAWALATGRDIRVGPGGVPVTLEPVVFDSQGREVCGFAEQAWSRRSGEWVRAISIQLATSATEQTCQSLELRIRHELGHVLARGKITDPDHAERGLMAPRPLDTDTEIDGDALALVCAAEPCF